MDGMLSQDEINALLSGMGSGGDDAESTGTATVTDTPDNNSAEDSFTLTESEKDASEKRRFFKLFFDFL